jgi:flagellar hook assembly protein FlgD
LRVFDVSGRLVRTLVSGLQDAGQHEVTWNGIGEGGHRLPSGVYLLQLRNGSQRESRRLVLVK